MPARPHESEDGRARNWTMPPLRQRREPSERPNTASVDNTCKVFDRRENQRCAFTMAEILLSLTIIGVVAAITLPSLTGNINERTWNTQRKALYARFSQAIALMPAVNGYGTVKEDASGSTIEDTAAESFITNGLSKVLQINNICDSEHLVDCGVSSSIMTLAGSKIELPKTMNALNPLMTGSFNNHVQSFYIKNTRAAAFETKNGESIVAYVNPGCVGNLQSMQFGYAAGGLEAGDLFQRTVCANFIYDLNGNKGPNTVGKDIGVMTVMYPSDPVIVAPYPASKILASQNLNSATKACTNFDSEFRMPNLEEAYSMFVNNNLLKPTNFSATNYWSSHRAVRPPNVSVGIGVKMGTGEIDDWTLGNTNPKTWCVKR